MSATIFFIFWNLISAGLGGLIVYLLLRSRTANLEAVHKELNEAYETLRRSDHRREAELDLSVRDREMQLVAIRSQLQECQKNNEALKTEMATFVANDTQFLADNPTANSDKNAQALERIRQKAANFDYTHIGVATSAEADDLKIISGVGPQIAERLNALGIYTFRQIAHFNDADIEAVTKAIEFFPGRIQRDRWVEQSMTLYVMKQRGDILPDEFDWNAPYAQ